MNFIKLLVPLLVGNFLAMPSYATGFQMPFSWGDYDDGSASVIYTSDYSEDSRHFKLQVTHSISGNQIIYFSDYYTENIDTCKYATATPDSTTMVFNGQAVKMLRWCKRFSDTGDLYFGLTPETVRGDNYVISLFKAATSPIEIKYNGETLYFPVMGFTKAWNSAGGNAI